MVDPFLQRLGHFESETDPGPGPSVPEVAPANHAQPYTTRHVRRGKPIPLPEYEGKHQEAPDKP